LVKQQTESNPVNGQQSEKLIKTMVKEAIPEDIGIQKPYCSETILQFGEIFYSVTNISDIPSPPPKA